MSAQGAFERLKPVMGRVMGVLSGAISAQTSSEPSHAALEELAEALWGTCGIDGIENCIEYVLLPLLMLVPGSPSAKAASLAGAGAKLPHAEDAPPQPLPERGTEAAFMAMCNLMLAAGTQRAGQEPWRVGDVLARVCTALTPTPQQAAELSEGALTAALCVLGVLLAHMTGRDVSWSEVGGGSSPAPCAPVLAGTLVKALASRAGTFPAMPLPILPPISEERVAGHLIAQLLAVSNSRTHAAGASDVPAGSDSPAPAFLPASVPPSTAALAGQCLALLLSVLGGAPGPVPELVLGYPPACRPGRARVASVFPGVLAGLTSWPDSKTRPGNALLSARMDALACALVFAFGDAPSSGEPDAAVPSGAAGETLSLPAVWGGETSPGRTPSTALVAGKAPQEGLARAAPMVVRVLGHCQLSPGQGRVQGSTQRACSQLCLWCWDTLMSCPEGRSLLLVCLEVVVGGCMQSGTVLSWGRGGCPPGVPTPPPLAHHASQVVAALAKSPQRRADARELCRAGFWEALQALPGAAGRGPSPAVLLCRRLAAQLRLCGWLADMEVDAATGSSAPPGSFPIGPSAVPRLVTALVAVLSSEDEGAAASSTAAASAHVADDEGEAGEPQGQHGVPLPPTSFSFGLLSDALASAAVEELLVELGWALAHPAAGDVWVDLLEECVEGAQLAHAAVFCGWVRGQVRQALRDTGAERQAEAPVTEAADQVPGWPTRQRSMFWRRVLLADVPPAVAGHTRIPAHVAAYTRAVLRGSTSLAGTGDHELGEEGESVGKETQTEDAAAPTLPPEVSSDGYARAHRGVRQRLLLARLALQGMGGVQVPCSALDVVGAGAAPRHAAHRARVLQTAAGYLAAELPSGHGLAAAEPLLPTRALLPFTSLWRAPQETARAASAGSASLSTTTVTDTLVQEVLQGGVAATGLFAFNPLPAADGRRAAESGTATAGGSALGHLVLPMPLAAARVHRQTLALTVSLLTTGAALAGPAALPLLHTCLFPLTTTLASPAYIVKRAAVAGLAALAAATSAGMPATPPLGSLAAPLPFTHSFPEHQLTPGPPTAGALLAHHAAFLVEHLATHMRELKSNPQTPAILRAVVSLASASAPQGGAAFTALLSTTSRAMTAALDASKGAASAQVSTLAGMAALLLALREAAPVAGPATGCCVFPGSITSSVLAHHGPAPPRVPGPEQWRLLRTSQSEQAALHAACAQAGERALAHLPLHIVDASYMTARGARHVGGPSIGVQLRPLPHEHLLQAASLLEQARHHLSSPHASVVVQACAVISAACRASATAPGRLFPALHLVWPALLPRLAAVAWWKAGGDAPSLAHTWGSAGAPGLSARHTKRLKRPAPGGEAAWPMRVAAMKCLRDMVLCGWAGGFLQGRWVLEGWPTVRNALLGGHAVREGGALGSSAGDEYSSTVLGGGAVSGGQGTVAAALPWLSPAARAPVSLRVTAESQGVEPGPAGARATAPSSTRLSPGQAFQSCVLECLADLALPMAVPSDLVFRGTGPLSCSEVEGGTCDEEFSGQFDPAQGGGWVLAPSLLAPVLDDALLAMLPFLHRAAPLQLQSRATEVLRRLSRLPGCHSACAAFAGAILQASGSIDAKAAGAATAASMPPSGNAVPAHLGTAGQHPSSVQREAQAEWGWGSLAGVRTSSKPSGSQQPLMGTSDTVQRALREAGAAGLASVAASRGRRATDALGVQPLEGAEAPAKLGSLAVLVASSMQVQDVRAAMQVLVDARQDD